ncbi:MAG: UDP-N-acetylmuramate dehydrogenase [Gammaproteobacteria bacterium]|nr:UDP-N-acetylmuramate dehydrogenase [Gammaproteobacteria bacterium]MDP2349058.1 UDP-N-acetylmuramate dehydrogenase [Gammaproteobacteria bacterium]
MQEYFDLQAHNTFKLSARARYFCAITDVQELRDALQFARARNLPLMVLGGGSNVLFRKDYPGVIVHMTNRGIDIVAETAEAVWVRAASGESWHGFVEYCLHAGLHGLENLALIPGCVGAAPIQNIGAYGVEVKELITDVEVLDAVTGVIETLTCTQCEFGYRDSIFKHNLHRRKIILSVTFRLHRSPCINLGYAALAQALSGIADPTPQQVFDAVCAIRRSKLPDPTVLGNAGSFFKNPVINREAFAKVLQDWPDLPSFPVAVDNDRNSVSNWVKVPAAWLIEKTGWKGRKFGQAGVYQQQPLVLVNHGDASAADILALAEQIMFTVAQQFGIQLELEVQWIPPRSSA